MLGAECPHQAPGDQPCVARPTWGIVERGVRVTSDGGSETFRGRFWLPAEEVRESDWVNGKLIITAESVTLVLKGESLMRQFDMFPEVRERWETRVVGAVGTETYVSISGCHRTQTALFTFGSEPQLTFKVTGLALISSDVNLVAPDPPLAHELHFEADGLPEWFARPLDHPPARHPWAMGVPRESPRQVTADCDRRECTATIANGLSLTVQNRLYWGDDGLFGLRIRQAAVATITSSTLVEPMKLLKRALDFTDFIRFISGEKCRLHGAVFYRHDRELPERYSADPRVGMGVLNRSPRHRLQGWGDMLVKQSDVEGHEPRILAEWFRVRAENRYATGLLDHIMTRGARTDAGMVLMVGTIQKLVVPEDDDVPDEDRKQKFQPYEKFLRDIGLESWGIDVAAMGKKLSELRGKPAHGDPLPAEPDVVSTFRFVAAALRIYFLREIGFSQDQCHRIAIRNRGVREALQLPDPEDADWNKMNRSGWIMGGEDA